MVLGITEVQEPSTGFLRAGQQFLGLPLTPPPLGAELLAEPVVGAQELHGEGTGPQALPPLSPQPSSPPNFICHGVQQLALTPSKDNSRTPK